MRKLLLTSTGFENKNFIKVFLDTIGKSPIDLKVLFLITAMQPDKEAQKIMYDCYMELRNLGILSKNIQIYDCDCNMNNEINNYDCIYVCGGNELHLMKEIIRSNFKRALYEAIENGLYYIGVSAGSVICSKLIPVNLNILPFKLDVHIGDNYTKDGKVTNINDDINLSNNQALLIIGNEMEIIS